MAHPDIIVIGASAGGIRAVTELVGQLPRELPATLFIVLHLSPSVESNLPLIFRRAGQLQAIAPRDREPIHPGYIYVAPPNWHMVFVDHIVHLDDGPRENGARPAVDPLFRSAAEIFGPRVIGIILSGGLDDGTAGLASIKSHGGIAIVQDPAEAEFESMPRSAIENVAVDHILPVAKMGSLIVQLVSSSNGRSSGLSQEGERSMNHESNNAHNTSPEWKLQFHCPDCGGVLLPVEEGEYVYFRCEVGHQYSPQTLLSDQGTEIESALWAAIRALGERSRLLEEMALKARRNGHMGSAGRFEQRQIELQEQTASIHKVLKMINADSDPGKSSG